MSTPGGTTTPSRWLSGLLVLVATGMMAQAVLAGVFISGAADVRPAHVIVGAALTRVAIVVAVVAVVAHRRGRTTKGLVTAAVALPLAIFGQEALGHAPGTATTAVHVPYGVALVTYAILLAGWSLRPVPRSDHAPRPAGTTTAAPGATSR